MYFFSRRTKSENDVANLLAAPVFVSFPRSLPSFDPTRELYVDVDADKLKSRIVELETQVEHLNHDLDDYRTDLLHTRNELYSEMLRNARHEQRLMDEFRAIQKLEAMYQRFCSMLTDVGIPRPIVDAICQAIQSGHSSPDDVLVDAIKGAVNDDSTLLSRLKPIIKNERTPEHYQSALNMTLSVRKELKAQKKRTKFWKKLAQDGDRHADIITPSPSEISSICQEFSSERRDALDALVARRRAVKCPENTGDSDVFGGQRRDSALDTLASSLASRPRRSFQEDLRLSSSFSSTSSASVYHSYLSRNTRLLRDSTAETPTVLSRLPSNLSTSLRRTSRGSTQSIVLGSINLNVSRSSSIDPTLQEGEEQQAVVEIAPASTITLSQDLLQNSRRASQGNGHRRTSSTTSRRSASTRSTRSSSFRLSTFLPFQETHGSQPSTEPDSDVSQRSDIDAPSFETPGIMRLSDLATSTDIDTPASSAMTGSTQDTPFSNAPVPSKCSTDTPFSPADFRSQIASTPLDILTTCRALSGITHAHDTRFLEHVDSNALISESAFESDAHVGGDGRHLHYDEHPHITHSATVTIPIGESKDSLFTSTSSLSDTPAPTTPSTPTSNGSDVGTNSRACKGSIGRSMLPVLAKHLRRLSLSAMSPGREGFVDKLRGLRSLSRPKSKSRSRAGSGSGSESASRSRSGSESTLESPSPSVWRGSPARSESNRSNYLLMSPSPSPVKGSGIPVLQRERRLTIRARRMTVRKG